MRGKTFTILACCLILNPVSLFAVGNVATLSCPDISSTMLGVSNWSSELKEFVDENKIPERVVKETTRILEERLNEIGETSFDSEVKSRFVKIMLAEKFAEDEPERPTFVYNRNEESHEAPRARPRFGGGDFFEAMSLLKQIHNRIPSPRELSVNEFKIAAIRMNPKGIAKLNLPATARRLGVEVADLKPWLEFRESAFFDEKGKPRDVWKSDDGLLDWAEACFRGDIYQATNWVHGKIGSKKNLGWSHYNPSLTVPVVRGIRDLLTASPEEFVAEFRDEAGSLALAKKFGLPIASAKKLQPILLQIIQPKLTVEQLIALNWKQTVFPREGLTNFMAEKLKARLSSDPRGVIQTFKSEGGPSRLAQQLGYAGWSPSWAKQVLAPLIGSSLKGSPWYRLFHLSKDQLGRYDDFTDEKGSPKSNWRGTNGLFAFAEKYFKGKPQEARAWARNFLSAADYKALGWSKRVRRPKPAQKESRHGGHRAG